MSRVPVLPVRLNGDVVYPVGEFEGSWCGPEIKEAIGRGVQVRCLRMAVYDKDVLYNEYVKTMYKCKQRAKRDGKPHEAATAKSLLNSAFGKWAQRAKRWQDRPGLIPVAPYTQWYGPLDDDGVPTQFRAIAWRVQQLVDAGEPGDSFPGVSAYISAYGRCRLWQLIETAGPENVYYYDTDSIFCHPVGFERLLAANEIDQDQIGLLSIRGKHTHVQIIGRQAYVCDGKLTASGVTWRRTTDGVTHAVRLVQPGLGHFLWRDQPPSVERHIQTLREQRVYRHGHVQADGSVLPLRYTSELGVI